VNVSELPRQRFDEASIVMADAFLDDPGWKAVGPDDPARLHSYIRRVCRGSLEVVRRWGAPIWHVERVGRVAGVLSTVDPGQWPPPQLRAIGHQAVGPVLGGPAVLWRSLAADSRQHKGHPEEDHLYVWMLTVSPAAQRSGVGRALLSTAIERAEAKGVPTYLDTANPANLPYYGSFGFEPRDQIELPRGAPLWFMDRSMR
jgi:ribosomal protein S18 acetylase RimI-like enzyme